MPIAEIAADGRGEREPAAETAKVHSDTIMFYVPHTGDMI